MRKLDDWLTRYMEFTEETEPPILYRKWVAVTCLSAALKRKVWLPWSIDEDIYANIYIVLVGPPGKCRKGTAIKPGISLVKELGIKLAPNALTREQLIRELNDSGDLTISTTNQYISHSSLTILSPELTVFLGYDNKALIMDLTDWYDCADNWDYRTKTQGSDEIAGVWVTLLGATTPQQVQTAFPLEAFGGGLASRIIFVFEDDKAKVVVDPFKTPKLEKLRLELLQDLGEIHRLSGPFQTTPEFMDRWADWYLRMDQTAPRMPPTFEGYLNRRQTHVRKLAMLMSVSRSDEMILREEDFNNGLKLLEETEVKMARTFAGVGSSRQGGLVVALMEYIFNKQTVTMKELYQDFYGSIESPQRFEETLNILLNQGFAFLKRNGTDRYLEYNQNQKLHGLFGGRNHIGFIPPATTTATA